MKTLLITILLIFSFNISHSQNNKDSTTTTSSIDKNELHLNALNLVTFNRLEIDYEYLLTSESSFGLSSGIRLDDQDDFTQRTKFTLTPYFRQYFTKKYARGFFVEGFANVLTREDDFFVPVESDTFEQQNVSQTDVALGISIGGKFITRGGFVAEIFGGIGRILGRGGQQDSFNETIGRGGVSVGYRF